MTTKPPPLVLVTWEDATVMDDSPWSDVQEHTYKARVFEQVGFLLSDTADGIILTCAWGEQMVAARDQIPRGMIRKVKRIKL